MEVLITADVQNIQTDIAYLQYIMGNYTKFWCYGTAIEYLGYAAIYWMDYLMLDIKDMTEVNWIRYKLIEYGTS